MTNHLPPREEFPWSCAFCANYKKFDHYRARACELYSDGLCKGSAAWIAAVAAAPIEQRAVKPLLFREREA